MNTLPLHIIFLCSFVYGLTVAFIELKRNSPKDKDRLGMAIVLIILGTTYFLSMLY